MFQGSAFSLHPCFFYKNCLDFYSSFSTINHIRFSSTLTFSNRPQNRNGWYLLLYYSFWRYSYVTRLDTSFRIPGESSPQNASSFQNAMKVGCSRWITRSAMMRASLAAFAVINIHLDAWIKHTATSFVGLLRQTV